MYTVYYIERMNYNFKCHMHNYYAVLSLAFEWNSSDRKMDIRNEEHTYGRANTSATMVPNQLALSK